MTAPNVVNVANITGKMAMANLTTVTANLIVNNSSSNTLVKINQVTVSNITSTAVACYLSVLRSGVNYFVASNVSVPGASSLVAVGKDSMIYLEEGDALQANATSNSAAQITSSYEIIQ
jgi:hypothetical protein